MKEHAGPLILVVAFGMLLGLIGFVVLGDDDGSVTAGSSASTTVTSPDDEAGTTTTPDPPTTTVPPTVTTSEILVREPNTVPGWSVGEPWGTRPGLTMFRGNPTRTYYGAGPLAASPSQQWKYPSSPMCSSSSAGGESKVWCGMGWTGQPVVYQRPDSVTELIFGAYDRAVHFVDADTGQDTRAKFVTGDIIKGSVTLDPDGYPLLYFGSRDNKLRIVALDRGDPEQMWSLDANAVNGIWNNDWDGNPVIIDDILYEGGENGWFFAFELHREYLSDGLVTVDPNMLLAIPGYNDDLLRKSGRNVSIETSVVAYEQRVYFGNSGGRVLGLDVSNIRDEIAPVVFDYYAGGDIDATIVVDEDGFLYVSIEHEPSQMKSVERDRNKEVGQLIKLDPYTSGDPRIWGIDLTSGSLDSGIWATPALHEGLLYVNTHSGDLIAVETETGEIVWSDEVGWHSWSSPSVVDDTLVVATCTGELRGYSLADPRAPVRVWTIEVSESCLEATPAIWNGSIYLGSRDGFMRAFR
ncbi:MAG: PQQ-binding-like beta-propeller repeat protein [Acidobacteria bacterium]|nr:PQQ-binding-like beta-propeller repeat protein [Acidobacteriota bacterium]